METVLDIVGVGVFILGILSALMVVIQFFVVFFGGREVGFGRVGSTVVGLVFCLLGGVWAAFLIWAGQALWQVSP